ncbi:MAG: adenylyltransferase/cytidyltransferase family protein [Patescibacteria group bacterium]|nr:adenylyltransferase/cytidyltransferase family protein [Patescibacteria group bacterium]
MNRIYVPGTFDMLHWGHIELFKKAKKHGTVIVSLNNDAFVARFKRKPILNYREREEMLKACRYVDEVIRNSGDEDSKPAILKSKATHIIHGDDWVGESYYKQMGFTQAWLDEHHIEILFVPYTKAISTSEIIQRCQR